MDDIERFGEYEINLSQRTLSRAGTPVRLSRLSIDVLVALAEVKGEIVNRATLVKRAWANKDIGNSAINVAINKLRQSLGPDGERIETVPGAGYRLRLNPAIQLPPTGVPENTADTVAGRPLASEVVPPSALRSPARLGWRYALWATGLLLALIAFLGAVVSIRTQPHVGAYHQLTRNGSQKVGPLFTNGKNVYFTETLKTRDQFVWRFASVPVTGEGDVRPVDLPGPAPCLVDINLHGEFLVRPDNRQPIDRYYIWSPSTGKLNPIGASGTCVGSISPDNRRIADTRSNLIVISDLPSQAEWAVRISGAQRARWSPDGRRLRFVVQNNRSNTSSVWECSDDGSAPHMILDEHYGFLGDTVDWTRTGDFFVFPRYTGAYLESRRDLWARPEDLPLLHRPVSLTEAPIDLSDPLSSRDSSTLFAIGRSARGELVRLDPSTHGWSPFLGGISAVDLDFSPDGRWVAYQQYPEHTLWRSRVDGTDAQKLTPAGLEAFQPHWAPDGKRIGFMGHESTGAYRIYTVHADGTALEKLKPDENFDQGVPSWSHDGSQVVFGELRYRKPYSDMALHVIDVNTRTETVLQNSQGKWTARWSPNGQYIVAASTDATSLVLYDVKTRSWRTLIEAPDIDDPTWSRDSKFIYFHCTMPLRGGPAQLVIARIGLDIAEPQILVGQDSMPPWHYRWFTITPTGDILLLQSVTIQEIYALDVTW